MKFFSKIFNLGTHSHYPEKLNEKIRLSNKFALFLAVSALPYYPMFFELKLPYTVELLNVCIVGYCLTFFFNALNLRTFSRIYLINYFNLMIFAYAMLFQNRTGIKLCYFSTACFTFYLFRNTEWKSLSFSLAGSLSAFLAVEFGYMPVWVSPFDLGNPEHPLNHGIAVTAFLLTAGSTLLYFFEIRRYEKKLSAASEQKSLFLSTMSHEIRTPLNVIIGMTNLLIENSYPQAEQQNFLSSIRMSSDHLLSLVNEVLDFERIEQGKVSLDLKPADLKIIIKKVEKIITPLAEEKNLAFTAVMKNSDDPIFLADERRLTQILLNLLGNSVKFTKKGSVSLLAEILEDSKEQSLFQFTIRDTGPGISKEDRKRIFETFYQTADNDNAHLGFGLGLSITLRLLNLCDSELIVESEPGLGSSFSFRIKFRKTQLLPEAKLSFIQDISGLRILAADDNELNMILLEQLLLKWKIQITRAENGKTLVSTFEKNPSDFDCILTDSHMPIMGGIEAVKRIRKNFPEIPIYLVSADATMELEKAASEAGADGVITKPIIMSSLYDIMLKVYSRKSSVLK